MWIKPFWIFKNARKFNTEFFISCFNGSIQISTYKMDAMEEKTKEDIGAIIEMAGCTGYSHMKTLAFLREK